MMIKRLTLMAVLFISCNSILLAASHELPQVNSSNPHEIILSTTSIPSRGSVLLSCKISTAYKTVKYIYVAPLQGEVKIMRSSYPPMGSRVAVSRDSSHSKFYIFNVKKSTEAITVDISDAKDLTIKCTY
jgi:hypothetical protein